MDLSLVSTEDLIEEIKNRCDHAVIATARHESGNVPIVGCYFTKNQWMAEVGLAEILKNNVMNNYNGELETLQKLNDER